MTIHPTQGVITTDKPQQEGIATVVISVGAYFFVQNYPSTAKFITAAERRFIQARLAADSDATLDERFTWANVIAALKDVKCWLYGFGFHTMSLPLYTFSLFLVCQGKQKRKQACSSHADFPP